MKSNERGDEDDNDGAGLAPGDGLTVLVGALRAMNVDILDIVVRTARSAHPRTFRALPIWYPSHHRGMPLFNAGWRTPASFGETSKRAGQRKTETNYKARDTLTAALGGRAENWTCCHIWGYDDPTFQGASLTHDRRFYTCVGNMVLLPTPVKALTDSMPEVKDAIRLCAFHLYGWTPDVDDHDGVERIKSLRTLPVGYPPSWPGPGRVCEPPGVVAHTRGTELKIEKRRSDLAREFQAASRGEWPGYPLAEAQAAVDWWRRRLSPR